MEETRLRTIGQVGELRRATPQVAYTAHADGAGGDEQRYAHISRVLSRFDYPHHNALDVELLVEMDRAHEDVCGPANRAQRAKFISTRAVCNSIGQRKAPRPNGRAGYVGIDTVHQGDHAAIGGGDSANPEPVCHRRRGVRRCAAGQAGGAAVLN